MEAIRCDACKNLVARRQANGSIDLLSTKGAKIGHISTGVVEWYCRNYDDYYGRACNGRMVLSVRSATVTVNTALNMAPIGMSARAGGRPATIH